MRHEAIDDHADRAVCTLPLCEHYPFGCKDRCATPVLGAFNPPQLLQVTIMVLSKQNNLRWQPKGYSRIADARKLLYEIASVLQKMSVLQCKLSSG